MFTLHLKVYRVELGCTPSPFARAQRRFIEIQTNLSELGKGDDLERLVSVLLESEETSFSFEKLNHILLASLKPMYRRVDLKDGNSIVTSLDCFYSQEVFDGGSSMNINQFVGLILFGDLILRPRVFHDAEVHVGTLLVVVRDEEDQGSFFCRFGQVSVVSERASFEIALNRTIILESFKGLDHFYLKFNCSAGLILAQDCDK
jgi:hypothetical protein